MFEVGQLLLILHWDGSETIMSAPPGLVIDRYEAVPQAFPNDPKSNESFVGSEKKMVYDVLLDGVLEKSIAESWLSAITDPLGRVEIDD